MTAPQLTFFCELGADALPALLSDEVIADLAALKAGVSLGILDLEPARAEAVRRLDAAGIPVTAWLLLPREQGYWFTLGNAPLAAARYEEFKRWSAAAGLRWSAIGLDIEPDIRDLEQLAAHPFRLLPPVFRRVVNRRELSAAETIYRDLARQVKSDGYRVESYVHPFIADERKSRSQLLRRATGLVDVDVDREVWMLYTSTFRPHGVGLLGSYGPEAQAIGLGVTGGGVYTGVGDPRPLSWTEFARDLRLAWYWSTQLYIFSLEGCVEHGYLPRLLEFAYDEPILMPDENTARVDVLRQGLQSFLWLSAHTGLILAGVAGGVALGYGVRRLVMHRRELARSRLPAPE